MRPVFSIKKILTLLVLCLLLPFVGCKNKVKDTLINGEWLTELTRQAGITSYQQDEPYYLNISSNSPYFSVVQSSVEWELLTPSKAFDPSATLTREMVAYTLMNLISRTHEGSSDVIKDLQDCSYPDQVKAAVASGLMSLDERQRFHPKEVISKEEAFGYLSQVIEIVNNRKFSDTKTTVQLKDDVQFSDEEPNQFDAETLTAYFQSDSSIQTGMYITHDDAYYRVLNCEYTNQGIKTNLELVNMEDVIDQFKIQGGTDLEFNHARIFDGNGNVIQEGTEQSHSLSLMSTSLINHTFDMKGFRISLKGTTSSLHAEVSKQLQVGGLFYANAALDNLHIQYKWDKDEDKIQYGYLKADFTTSENIGLRNGMYKELYGDFSKLNPKDFISTVQNIFQTKQEVLTDTLTLCTVKIPLPNAPMVSVVMKLNLNIYATGKAELAFVQNHVVGCEIRNGNMRIITDHSKKATASIRAETGITLGTNLALHAFNQNIMDAEVDAGAKGYFRTKTYLYNDEGKAEAYDIDIQPDLVEELSEGNPDIKVCTELNAYWLCNLKLNSSNSLAGRFGFGRNIPILSESNAPLFPTGKVTYENWMSVDHCSCEDREKAPTVDPIQVKKRITLKDYSLITGVGISTGIQVSGLPEGYTIEDLIYTSKNEEIAVVNTFGEVTGKKTGGTDILIQTKDKKHLVHCHILVVELNRK